MTPGIYIIKLFTAVRITIAKTYKWTLAIKHLLILASQTEAVKTSLFKTHFNLITVNRVIISIVLPKTLE
jgi:hypothetical protein